VFTEFSEDSSDFIDFIDPLMDLLGYKPSLAISLEKIASLL
jgi:hypothetical protein